MVRRMRLYVNFRKLFITTIGIGLYTLIFVIFQQCDFIEAMYSIIHALLAAVAVDITLNTIETTESRCGATISLGGICLYTINTYYILSIIKYGAYKEYATFTDDIHLRFFGSIIVFAVVLLTNKVLRRRQVKFYKKDNIKLYDNALLTYLLIIFASILIVYYAYKEGSRYAGAISLNTPTEAFFAILRDLLSSFAVAYAVNHYNSRKPYTGIPLAIYVVSIGMSAAITGSRTQLIKPIILIIYSLILLRKIKVEKLRAITAIMPIAIIVVTSFTFLLSSRREVISFDEISNNIGYRFDLTDLSMTYFARTGWLKFDPSTFLSGVIQAIPSAFLPEGFKKMHVTAYEVMIRNNGLYSYSGDFPDTYFSMGAELLGVIGMIAIPILFVYIFERIDQYAMKKYANGLFIRIAIVGWVVTIERAWTEMIPLYRNLIIYIVIALISERLFFKYQRNE